MQIVKAILFQILFYALCSFWFTILLFFLVLPYRWFMQICWYWSRSCVWLHKTFYGITVEIRGREYIPTGAALVASKHQSAWETMGLHNHMPYLSYILKQELTWIPVFGWHLIKARMVPINRAKGPESREKMLNAARRTLKEGRQIVIFPEGTRRPVGAPPLYKFGVAALYADLKVPCTPVAHNSGLVWPRRGFIHHPHKIIVEFMPPIEAGLEPKQFLERLRAAIETKTDALVTESIADKAQQG